MSNLYTAYLDDSGTDPRQKIAIATGLIIPASKIVALEDEWNELKEKWGFSCFHMSEFSARNGKKEPRFATWNDYQHKRVYQRVRTITKKYGVKTVSFAVHKDDYDMVVPHEIRQWAGMFHYTWAVRQFITWIDGHWRRTHTDQPLQYVFDNMKSGDERRVEIEKVMDQAAALSDREKEYANYAFRCRCDLPGLQCADVLAWIAYQVALLAFMHKPLVSDAEIGWRDFDNHRISQWRDSKAVLRPALEKWVRDETVSGKALARYRQWEKSRGKS